MNALDDLQELDEGTILIAVSLLYDFARKFDLNSYELHDALEAALERYYKWRDIQAV